MRVCYLLVSVCCWCSCSIFCSDISFIRNPLRGSKHPSSSWLRSSSSSMWDLSMAMQGEPASERKARLFLYFGSFRGSFFHHQLVLSLLSDFLFLSFSPTSYIYTYGVKSALHLSSAESAYLTSTFWGAFAVETSACCSSLHQGQILSSLHQNSFSSLFLLLIFLVDSISSTYFLSVTLCRFIQSRWCFGTSSDACSPSLCCGCIPQTTMWCGVHPLHWVSPWYNMLLLPRVLSHRVLIVLVPFRYQASVYPTAINICGRLCFLLDFLFLNRHSLHLSFRSETYIDVSGKAASAFVFGSSIGQMSVPLCIGLLIDSVVGTMALIYVEIGLVIAANLFFFLIWRIGQSSAESKVNKPKAVEGGPGTIN